jgi:hypothetical protein
LLFKFGAAALGALNFSFVVLAFIVFGNGQGQGKLGLASLAEIFVVGHSHLPPHSSADDLSRAGAAQAIGV